MPLSDVTRALGPSSGCPGTYLAAPPPSSTKAVAKALICSSSKSMAFECNAFRAPLMNTDTAKPRRSAGKCRRCFTQHRIAHDPKSGSPLHTEWGNSHRKRNVPANAERRLNNVTARDVATARAGSKEFADQPSKSTRRGELKQKPFIPPSANCSNGIVLLIAQARTETAGHADVVPPTRLGNGQHSDGCRWARF